MSGLILPVPPPGVRILDSVAQSYSIRGGQSVGTATSTSVTTLTIWNSTSTHLIYITRLFGTIGGGSGGQTCSVDVNRITAEGNGGTLTPVLRDTANDASIATIRSGGTAPTRGSIFAQIVFGAGSTTAEDLLREPLTYQPLILRENEGVEVRSTTGSGGTTTAPFAAAFADWKEIAL